MKKAWWSMGARCGCFTPVVLALGRLRQEYPEFKASLWLHSEKFYQNKQTNKTKESMD
jgi:hypothetical protein